MFRSSAGKGFWISRTIFRSQSLATDDFFSLFGNAFSVTAAPWILSAGARRRAVHACFHLSGLQRLGVDFPLSVHSASARRNWLQVYQEIVAGRRLYRWGSMQGGSIAAPDDAAFLSAPCRSSKGGSIILHRQDPGPRQKDDLDDQRSAAMVDSDGGAFPPGWRNEATPCQQPPKRPCFSKPGKLYGYDHPSRGRCTERLNFHVSMISIFFF